MFGLGNNAGYGAAKAANNVATGYGTQAGDISSTLLPFLTRELNSPQGYTQQQTGAMLDSAEAGAGGSTAGLTTEANLAAARNRNSGGFSGALDQAAREKDKALASTGEGISAQNANLQQKQQQDAASGLSSMNALDTGAQLKALGLVPEDLNAQANLNKNPDDWATQLGRIGAGIGGFAAGVGAL